MWRGYYTVKSTYIILTLLEILLVMLIAIVILSERKWRKNKCCCTRFSFFFFLKGIRAGSWRNRDIFIIDKNATDINFGNISGGFYRHSQVFSTKFRYTCYHNDWWRKTSCKKECEKFVLKDEILSKKFNECPEENKQLVFKYLSTGKCVIP